MGAPEQQHVNLSYGISLINMQHEDRNTYRRAKDSTAQNRGTSFFFFFFFLPPLTGELPHVAKLTCSSFCSFSLITTGIDTGNKSRSGIPADPTGSPSPIPYLDILGVDIFSECQLPKRQLPKMSTPKMPTPKMSTLKNLNFK